MSGNMVVEKKIAVAPATGWTLTWFMSVLYFFLFLSLHLSLFLGVPLHSLPISLCIHMSNTKSEIWEHTCKQGKMHTPQPAILLQKVNNDLLCDSCVTFRSQWTLNKIRVWLVHEGFFPIVQCPLRGCVTFRNTNNVLMMQYFHRAAPCHQVLQLSLVCPLKESNT